VSDIIDSHYHPQQQVISRHALSDASDDACQSHDKDGRSLAAANKVNARLPPEQTKPRLPPAGTVAHINSENDSNYLNVVYMSKPRGYRSAPWTEEFVHAARGEVHNQQLTENAKLRGIVVEVSPKLRGRDAEISTKLRGRDAEISPKLRGRVAEISREFVRHSSDTVHSQPRAEHAGVGRRLIPVDSERGQRFAHHAITLGHVLETDELRCTAETGVEQARCQARPPLCQVISAGGCVDALETKQCETVKDRRQVDIGSILPTSHQSVTAASVRSQRLHSTAPESTGQFDILSAYKLSKLLQ